MQSFSKIIFLASIALSGAAQASMLTFETASSNAGTQIDAAAYRETVNQAFNLAGGQTTAINLFDNVSNQSAFGGSNSNIAYRTTIEFGVAAGQAGSWDLRAGVDFGNGGAVYLDGVALGYKTNDMWWGGSYGNPSQAFEFSSVAVAAGNHKLQFFGLENCCDGGEQAQFNVKGAGFQTFGTNDGLTAAVPEPETYALMLAGLGALGFTARRRYVKAAAV
jgi:hypothetical protein